MNSKKNGLFTEWNDDKSLMKKVNYKNDWNGEANVNKGNSDNGKLPEGVYYYIINLNNDCEIYKGYVYLRRRY